jgi:hypothetical protein
MLKELHLKKDPTLVLTTRPLHYASEDGSEMWVRAGILAMNLKAAVKRA